MLLCGAGAEGDDCVCSACDAWPICGLASALVLRPVLNILALVQQHVCKVSGFDEDDPLCKIIDVKYHDPMVSREELVELAPPPERNKHEDAARLKSVSMI